MNFKYRLFAGAGVDLLRECPCGGGPGRWSHNPGCGRGHTGGSTPWHRGDGRGCSAFCGQPAVFSAWRQRRQSGANAGGQTRAGNLRALPRLSFGGNQG